MTGGFIYPSWDDEWWIRCDGSSTSKATKWGGWTEARPWKIDSVEFDLKNGENKDGNPEFVGSMVIDNRLGSI